MGWVLGTGLGHITKLVPLAKKLEEHGHTVHVALKPIKTTLDYLERHGIKPIPALGPPNLQGKSIARTFDGILHNCGFNDAKQLRAEVVSWDALIDVTRPDVVVVESSPALQLACYDRIPMVLCGTGYTVPPHSSETFPVVYPNGRNLGSPEQVMEVITEVQQKVGRPVPPNAPTLFDHPSAIWGVRELDPYRAHRSPEEAGLPIDLSYRPVKSSATSIPPRIFAYLARDHKEIPTILGALGRLEIPVELYCDRLSDAMRDHARSYGITMHDEPQDLQRVVTKSSVVVHHGGLGTSQAVLSIGRPQLLLPKHGEGSLNAAALKECGVGRVIRPGKTFPEKLEPFLHRSMKELPEMDRLARERAEIIAERETTTAPARALELVLRTLES